ncbi:MAG: PhoH family protein, partial [Aquabacterium sp.]|uniref:PhoH family protein n=1 Tax=Aquabacterium sp. TaxID=1872578 RepID=UPI003BB19464
MPLRHSFTPPDNARLAHLCGPMDDHLRTIEAAFDVKVARRGEAFRIDGPKAQAQQVLNLLEALYAKAGRTISAETVQLAISQEQQALGGPGTTKRGGTAKANPADDSAEGPTLHTRRADLQGRTPNQVQYLKNIMGHDMSFGIGPAGTGKTFLAVACAVDALERS